MKKSNRQGIIRRLIQEHEIETQEELLVQLSKNGVEATQATVSRDIREIGIVKGHGSNGQSKYVIVEQSPPQTSDRLREAIAESVEQVTRVQFIVIVKTALGSANIVAAIIDELNPPEIAGTLAGADTLAIITHNELEAADLVKQFKEYMLEHFEEETK